MINLLLAGNARIFDGILTCALSIFRRSGGKEYAFISSQWMQVI